MDTEVIKSLAARVKIVSCLKSIKCAANLAHRGLLDDVESIWLGDPWHTGDLSIVPIGHLASLVSSVKGTVNIEEFNDGDLVTIFDSLKCKALSISHQRLGRSQSYALGRAMESCVTVVMLFEVDGIDVKAMTEYTDLRRCMNLICESETDVTYARELRRWAHRERVAYLITTEEGVFCNDDFEDEDYEKEEDNIRKVNRIVLDLWKSDL